MAVSIVSSPDKKNLKTIINLKIYSLNTGFSTFLTILTLETEDLKILQDLKTLFHMTEGGFQKD